MPRWGEKRDASFKWTTALQPRYGAVLAQEGIAACSEVAGREESIPLSGRPSAAKSLAPTVLTHRLGQRGRVPR